MSEKEFKVGDWVVVKLEETQFTGIITNKTELGYEVKDNNHYYQFVLEQYMERIDPKTAFLSELSKLLRKYNATMRWSIGMTYEHRIRSSANIEVHTPNFHHYFSGETGVTLTADNVFDNDKG